MSAKKTRTPKAADANSGLRKRDTGEWIEATGFVVRLLHDDDDGSRHQRFSLDTGEAVLETSFSGVLDWTL